MLTSGDEFGHQHSTTSSTGALIDHAASATKLHHHHHLHHHSQPQQQQPNSSVVPKQISSQQPFNSQGAGSELNDLIVAFSTRRCSFIVNFALPCQHSCVRFPLVHPPLSTASPRRSTHPLLLPPSLPLLPPPPPRPTLTATRSCAISCWLITLGTTALYRASPPLPLFSASQQRWT